MNVRIHRYQRRHDHGQHDIQENAIPAAAVNAGGLIHIPGDAADKLHDQEDVERAAKECRHDQRQKRAHPAHFVKQHEAGNHRHHDAARESAAAPARRQPLLRR